MIRIINTFFTILGAAVVYFSRVNAIWLIIAGVALGLLSSTLGANWF